MFEHIFFSVNSNLNKSSFLFSVPVIAEVKGLAAAAGLQLCASCDIVVASSDALFSVPG